MSPIPSRQKSASPEPRRLASVKSGGQERAALLLAVEPAAPADLEDTLAASGINLAGPAARQDRG